MRKILTIFIIALPFCSLAQSNGTGFGNFIKFVSKNYKIENEVRQNCDWQYAIVKLNIDANNRVVNYTILNSVVSDVFKKSFNYIKGYQFAKNVAIRQRPVIFYFTVQNDNDHCDIDPQNHSPSDVTMQIFSVLNEQAKLEPKTIFIYEPVLCVIYPIMK